jgi:hypothetical protein
MKRILYLASLLACTGTAVAQQGYPNSFDNLAAQAKTAIYTELAGDSARASKMYTRWCAFWRPRVCDTLPAGKPIGAPYYKILTWALDNDVASCLGSGGYRGSWRSMGPYRNNFGCNTERCHKMGHIASIWVDPANSDTILAGAASGGLWKTTDGGMNWRNITDNSPSVVSGTLGVSGIAVNPLNKNHIYLLSSITGNAAISWPYYMGLVKSTDGGVTWSRDNAIHDLMGLPNTGFADFMPKVAYRPGSQSLYVTYMGKAYLKKTPAAAWQDITPAALSTMDPRYRFTDFEFTIASPGKVVFSTNCRSGTQYLFTYNEAANTWATKAITISGFNEGTDLANISRGIKSFTLTGADSALMLLFLRPSAGGGEIYKIYKTGLPSAAVPYQVSSSVSIGQPRELVVNRKNDSVVYLTNTNGAGTAMHTSVDGGRSFDSTTDITYADGRCILLYKDSAKGKGLYDVVYTGNDGGIALKSRGDTKSHSLNGNGLCITQFYGLSTNPVDNRMMLAGAQDNGSQTYDRRNAVPWGNTGSWFEGAQDIAMGDGWIPAFARNGEKYGFVQSNERLIKMTFGSTGGMPTGLKLNIPSADMVGLSGLRKIKFDSINTARMGYHYIWKLPSAGTDWALNWSTITNEPKSYSFTDPRMEHKKSIDFIISEKNPDIAYLLYEGTTGAAGRHLTEPYGRLYRSTTANTAVPTWSKIDVPLSDWYPITDIEVDANDPSILYASFGGVVWNEVVPPATAREGRVYRYTNYGSSVEDISTGLPPLPIYRIISVKGYDELMFAATETGVYKWNKAQQQWECFNDGMPKCIVSDIEVNYCSGKLRIATYGRGIWESPYGATYADINPGEVYTINANTTWNQSKTIEGSIRVKAGQTLTISGSGTTVYMPQRGEIRVEKGGKLVLDGARITNGCDSSRWLGIVLTGNKALSPTAANQATFEMKNGAIIENAAVGVRDYNDATLQGGGRILASNSTFLNCWKAVSLNDYPNFDRSTSCTFTNVTFKVNSNSVMAATNGILPPHLFTAFNERGVKLKGCTFTDERMLDHGDKRATAFGVTDADFTIDSCDFMGLQRGVYADVVYFNPMAPKPTVVNSRFDNTRENITIYAHNPLIRANSFTNLKPDLPGLGSPGLKKAAWAVYLEGTRGASVYGNAISGSSSTTLNVILNRFKYGVIAKNTHNLGGLAAISNIINNSITNVYAGVQTELVNTQMTINCNSFTRNTNPLSINPATGYMGADMALISKQNGSCSSGSSRPNNIFSNNVNGIYSWISNPPNYLQYYVNSTGPGAHIPTGNWGGVNIISCTGLGQTDVNLRCSRIPVIIWNSSLLSSAVSAFTSAKAADPDSDETWYQYAEVIRGYTQLDNLQGLKSFLLSDNTDASKTQLLPIYLNEGNYQTLTSTINGLSASSTEKSAYHAYFNILVALKQSNRNLLQLTQNEKATMQSLANSDTHIANAAKSLLEWGYDIAWDHIPEEPAQQRPGSEVKADDGMEITNKSHLGDAAPNPVTHTTQIPVWVLPYDAANGCYLVVRDIMGKEMARYTLHKGENVISVNTAAWTPGIYAYSLLVDQRPVATKKLSKVQ